MSPAISCFRWLRRDAVLHPSGMQNNLRTAFPSTGQRRPTWSITNSGLLVIRSEAVASSKWSFQLPTSQFREIQFYEMSVIRE